MQKRTGTISELEYKERTRKGKEKKFFKKKKKRGLCIFLHYTSAFSFFCTRKKKGKDEKEKKTVVFRHISKIHTHKQTNKKKNTHQV